MPARHRRSSPRPAAGPVLAMVVGVVVAALVGGYVAGRFALPERPKSRAGLSAATAAHPTPSPPTASPPTPSPPTASPPTASPAATGPVAAARSTSHAADAHRWRRVLARLDAERALAWRTGHPALLRRVWTPTSTGLPHDRAMLRRYSERGLSVTGVSLVLERVRVVDAAPSRVVLRTVDRLRPMTAVRHTGHVSTQQRLPRDRPTRHLITLLRTGDGWRISEVVVLS